MKARAAAVQGGLALAALVAAWATWQRPADRTDEGESVLLDLSKRDVQTIRYDDAKKQVELARRDDAVWIVERQKPPAPPEKKPDGSTDGKADGASDGATDAALAQSPPPPPPAKPPRELKGGDLADKLWERFAPLRAQRSLGKLDEAKRKELGLDASDKILEVVARGTTHRFRASTASGIGSTYLEDQKDGTVWLLKGSLLSDLESAASRLPDRAWHKFGTDEFDGLVVKAQGKEKRYVVPAPGKLAPKESPEANDEFARNWSDRVWRVFSVELLGKGELPAAGEPAVEARVEYLRGETSVGWMELARAGTDIYTRTENTAGWVKLSASADSMLKEAPRVAGGETKEEPKAEPAQSKPEQSKPEPAKPEAKTK